MTAQHDSEEKVVRQCVAAYDIGALEGWQRHGGTAGKTWRVSTPRGSWFLRMRGVRTSSAELVTFDHGLRRHLVRAGIPTAAPVASCSGSTSVRIGERTFELYPLVDGCTLPRAGRDELQQAARMLARFHGASADFPGRHALPPVSQYSTLGLSATSARMEAPALLTSVYQRLATSGVSDAHRDACEACLRWLHRLRTEFGDDVYGRLPHTVTHGDYTLANLLFSADGSVCGVFDFDWARWAPRVRDIADGMFFIGGERRTPLVPADIWSLTEDVSLHQDRCVLWLQSYSDVAVLTHAELDAVGMALAARWLSVRVEGMAKVDPGERLRFCFGNVTPPLRWLDENWGAVCRGVTAG